MVDLRQKFLNAQEVAELVPGGETHPNTVLRWYQGIRIKKQEVKLRHIRVGRKLLTTEEWVGDFLEACAEAGTSKPQPIGLISPHRRESQGQAAADLLARKGC